MDDLISRQAAIDAADSADYTGLSVEDVKKVTDEVVKALKMLPPAQPEYTDSEKEMLSMMFSIFDKTLSAWYLEINHESFSRNDLYYLAKKLGIDYD